MIRRWIKSTKRGLSIALTAALVITMTPTVGTTASAETATDERLTEEIPKLQEAENSAEEASQEDETEESSGQSEADMLDVEEESTQTDVEVILDQRTETKIYAAAVNAADDFTVDSSGKLTAYTGAGGDITIPDGVVEIDARVFQDNTAITKVVFPNSIRTIGGSAFYGCTTLAAVELNEGLETIGDYAFYRTAFGSEESTGKITYGTLEIPGSVRSIGVAAFSGCTYLKEVTFSEENAADTLTFDREAMSGGNGAFADCPELEKVVLPNRLKVLGSSLFSGDSKLKEVQLGDAVETIENNAFNGCSSLQGIDLPQSVTKIGGSAFYGCSSLEYANLNEGLETIGANAFQGAAFGSVESTGKIHYGTLEIPGSVQSIEAAAFYGCTYLKEVTFSEENAADILTFDGETMGGGNGAFADCPELEKVVLPNRLKVLGSSLFSGDSKLKEVQLGDVVETIGNSAFNGCSSLQGIDLPQTVTTIGNNAFYGCSSLEYANLNEGLETIGHNAFYNAGISGTFTIPSTVQSIGSNALFGCSYLEEVTFENGETVVLELSSSFGGCSSLKRVYLPDRLKELRAYTFSSCDKLETVYIPETVITIAANAISNCPNVTIYGEVGSAAEKYATDNNIPFKSADELGFSVTGVSLNRSLITQAGENAIGTQIQLIATVKPATAKNKAVTFTSTNTEVATVDDKGLVTLIGYGEADIVVTTVDGVKTATCHVLVQRQWSEEEKADIRQQMLELNNELTIITNVYPTVEDITLKCPEGLEAQWRLPYYISTGRQEIYDVIITKEGYQEAVIEGLVITGITIEGVSIQGKDKLQNGKETIYTANILVNGGNVSESDYELKWESASNSGVSLSNQSGNAVTVKAVADNKTATVKVVLTLKKNGSVLPTDKSTKDGTWFEASAQLKTFKEAVADRIVITAKDKTGAQVNLNSLRELENISDALEYSLSAEVYDEDQLIQNPSLQWKSGDTKIAEVKAAADGTASLVIKAKGAATISVTANKNGGCTSSFKVIVKDSTPKLEEASITVNLYQETPQAMLHLLPSDGYAVDAGSLSIVKADGTDSDFAITRISEIEYLVGIKAGKSVSTGKQRLFISAKTSAQEAEAHRLPLTIQISKQAPKVTLTQEAINLYEKDGAGRVFISANAEIESIIYTPSVTSGVRLVQKGSFSQEGYFIYGAEGADSNNYAKASAKGTLKIKFKGYTDEASYNKVLTLKTNKKLPALKAVPTGSVMYPDTVANRTDVEFVLKSDNSELLYADGWRITAMGNPPAGITVTGGTEEQSVQVAMTDAAKSSSSLKFAVTNTHWYDGVKVNVSCTLKKGKTPELAFSNSKVILNKAYELSQYDVVKVGLSMKNFGGQEVSELVSVKGKDAKAEDALTALYFSIVDGSLQIGIADSSYFTKQAKFTYVIQTKTQDGIPLEGKLNVTVAAANAAITYKQNGSINLLDREGTKIICKPTLKNYSGTVEDVQMYGVGAEKFSASCEGGNIVIRAREGASLNIKTTYKFTLESEFESGVKLKNEIKIMPKQTNPKLTQSTKKLTMYESVSGMEYGSAITISPVKADSAGIADVELVNGGDTFYYEYDAEGSGKLYVSENASSKTNKTYKLKFAVRFKDGAANAAPVYVTVSVSYKR